MIVTLLATNIQYDFDGPEETGYPESMEVQVELSNNVYVDVNRQVCTQISNATGMLVLDYDLFGYSSSPECTLCKPDIEMI